MPVVLPRVTQAASWGAAVLAGVGAGAFSDPDITTNLARDDQRSEPNPENLAVYQRLFDQYKQLHPLVCKPELSGKKGAKQ